MCGRLCRRIRGMAARTHWWTALTAICPHCGAEGNHRYLLSLGNLLRATGNVLLFVIGLPVSFLLEDGTPLLSMPIALRRRCSSCRMLFHTDPELLERPPIRPVCRSCNYDLRGNTSGVCPECGWKLSEEVQESVAGAGATKTSA